MRDAAQPTSSEIRDNVINFLVFFTSDQCEAACAQIFTDGKFAYELARTWFRDIYWAGERYIDHYKGDYSSEKSTWFRAAFSDDEWKTLERFHRFFELRIDMLPESYKNAAAFPKNDSWQHLVKDATYLVEELEPDANQRAQRLKMILERLFSGQVRPFAGPGMQALSADNNGTA